MDSTERARVLAQNLQPGDKQTAEAALGGLCAELRSGQVHLLNQYVQLSPQCAELFALWENQEGDGNRIVTLVIETLANVLEKKFDEGLRTVKTRQGVAAKVLSEHLQLLYRYLGTERDQLLKVCLRLLTGISSTSQALSAQLLRTFNFGLEGFSRLANRRFHVPKKEKKEKAQIDAGRVDVRSLFSSFALSFLQWKDPALTSSALGIKDLIGGVLRGLSQDPPKQALTVVRDVLEHVVRLKQLPRQTKVFFFNAFALRHFCSLLSSEDQELSSAANELLKEVCCSRQLFPSHKEELLLDICLELRTHEAQQEFVIAVLRSHPALHLQFCGRLKLALQPRLSRACLLNIRFLRTLLEMEVSSLRSEALNLIGHENTDAVQELRLSWIQEALIPKAMQKTLITQALLQQNAIIRLAALQLLIAALQRLQRAVVGCSWEPAEKEELLQRAQHQLPELNTLLLLWQQLCKEEPSFDLEGSTPSKSKGAKGAKGAKRKHGGAAEEWPVENGDNGDADAYETTEVLQVTREEMLQWMGLDGPDMPSHLVFTCWCKSIQRYLEVLPQSALDVKFDWSKLLSAVATPIIESKGGDVYRTLACVKCVAVAMHSRSQSMQLSKSQRAWLETLLRLRSSASVSEELREECTGQILTFLLGRGLLGRSERVELELLLLALEKRPQCVGFVGQVLQALFSRPGYFMSLAEAPSLLPVALLQHLTRRDPQSLALPPSATQQQRSTTALTCCKMVKHFLLQMASSLPETAKAVLGLVRSIGEWKAGSVAQEEEDPSTAGDTPAEGLRQELLEKLRSRKRKREDDDGPPEAPEADAVAEAMAALKSEELLLPQKREVFLKLAQDDRITLLHRLLETLSPAASQVISWDRPALVQLAMTAQIPLLAAKSNKGLTLALLPVFEQISWSHPQNRKALTKQLTWQSGDPAAVLQLAAALVPERVSFLNAVEGLTAASLRPLPSKEQLLSLFVLNPAPLLLKMVCEAMEQEDGGILRAASFRFEIELLQRVEGAFSHFLDAINAEELSDEQMLEAAGLVVKALPLVGDLPQEKLKDFVKLSTGREKKAAALVLGSLHQMERQSWHVPAARRLLSLISEEMPSDWLLQHAVLWWSQLLPKLEKLQDFIAQLEQNYRGSLSPSDLLTWQLLCSAAQFAAGADANSWSFRSWAHRLKPLGGGTWSWDLDQRRVRATAEIFRFDRGAQEKAAERDAYDIAYLLPFLAGQLRLTYQESGGVASQSLGATLSAAMCGGALELLLLGTACAEPLLRACAFEALSIVLAIAHFWNVTSFEKDEANKRLPFRELPELVRLLCYVRDGLDTPEDDNPPTLPRLAASFFAGCVPVLIQPQHMLYQTLAKYLFGKPAADFQDVPLFYKLLLPQTADSQEARLWFLRILRRGLATGGALGGDEISRRALARRHVLPWLMSFAGSKELGSFPILMEVINCLEASLTAPTYAAEGTALRLSVAEWTANQAVRPSGARHSVQVLLALGRLVTALLKMPGGDLEKSRVAKHGTHLLTLGRALKALATACRHTLESSDEETQDASRLKLVTMLWEQIGRLGKLVQRLQALDSGIVEEDASNRCAAAGWALAAELDSALKLTSLCGRLMKLDEVSQSRKLSAQALVKVASSSSSLKDLLGELVVLLQATPSSTLLYNMVVDVVQHTLVEGDVKTCWSLETQQEAVSAMWQILRAKAKKVFTCSETKESLCKMLCAVLALPHHPSMEWRVRLLIAAILSLQQAPDEQLQRLLAELPSPMKAICPKEDGGKHLEPTVTNVLRYVLVPEAKSAQLRRKSEKLLQ